MSVCMAKDCTRQIREHLKMCPVHWRKVPKPLQNEVWRNYKVGQTDETASPEFMKALEAAVTAAERVEEEQKRKRQSYLAERFGR